MIASMVADEGKPLQLQTLPLPVTWTSPLSVEG